VLTRLARGRGAGIPGRGRQRVTPIALGAVVDAIVAADSREAFSSGTWELGGREAMTMNEAAERLLPGAKLVRATRSAPKALLDVYGRDVVADPSTVQEKFGLKIDAM